MKFAIIPWSEKFQNDQMFNTEDPLINRDHLMEPMKSLQDYFISKGDELHTIDLYSKIEEIDYFLFFSLDWEWFKKIVKIGKADAMVYCTCEPPSVDIRNTPRSYKFLKSLFPYILTWNEEWVDNQSIFKRNNEFQIYDTRKGMLEFTEKKLITFISGNKYSDFPGELYSERRNAIDFFEKNYCDEFDFYGTGWSKEEHPCYGGSPKSKSEVYHNYKFAICYENISMCGYITEKIFDCLTSGTVPIYCGAPNIGDYIPKGCFIDRNEFNDYEELAKYLKCIDEDTYKTYLKAADSFLAEGTPDEFTGKRYAEYIYKAINNAKPQFNTSIFKMWCYRIWFRIYEFTIKHNKNGNYLR